MTDYILRTDLRTDPPDDPTILLLDWAPGRTASTIHVSRSGKGFFDGWRAPRPATDLALLGAAAYCVDKTALRNTTEDQWTRELSLQLPVSDVEAWRNAKWASVLSFLTGDRWTLTPTPDQQDPLAAATGVPDEPTPVGPIDAVCLFSGGLDSLSGVIDLLETNPQRCLCLLSHNEGGKVSNAQKVLLKELIAHYGPERLVAKRLYLRPAPAVAERARALPSDREHTTRARSALFLTFALTVAASVSPTTPVYIPENGSIGINVPLTRARSGSYSTRTTHPHFIDAFMRSAATVGVTNPILNPYRLMTKGEVLASTRNATLLRSLAPKSVSCSHPEAARYAEKGQGNCGYCFPCLIRRASMAHVGWDESTDYPWNALDGKGASRSDDPPLGGSARCHQRCLQ